MLKNFTIATPKGPRKIGEGQPCFIVAEMSSNHQQNFDQAIKIIKAAATAGADAIKLQTYTPDTITMNSDKKWFLVGGKKNPKNWKGQTFYQLYQKSYMPWEWQPKLKKVAEKLGLVFFSAPFDETAVDFLEKLNVPCYKIAAYESAHVPLLEKVAKTGKPVIISVGFSSLSEVKMSVQTLRRNGAKDIVILQCPTSYASGPKIKETNLRTMLDIKKRFQTLSGLSDNMGGIEVPVLAAALGASIIEKHFVLSHGGLASDERFSLDKKEFKRMVDAIRQNELLLGKVVYGPQTEEEKYNKNFCRSLFVVRDVKKGEKLAPDNVRCIRPGYGLVPKLYHQILGKKAKHDIQAGTPLQWKLIM